MPAHQHSGTAKRRRGSGRCGSGGGRPRGSLNAKYDRVLGLTNAPVQTLAGAARSGSRTTAQRALDRQAQLIAKLGLVPVPSPPPPQFVLPPLQLRRALQTGHGLLLPPHHAAASAWPAGAAPGIMLGMDDAPLDTPPFQEQQEQQDHRYEVHAAEPVRSSMPTPSAGVFAPATPDITRLPVLGGFGGGRGPDEAAALQQHPAAAVQPQLGRTRRLQLPLQLDIMYPGHEGQQQPRPKPPSSSARVFPATVPSVTRQQQHHQFQQHIREPHGHGGEGVGQTVWAPPPLAGGTALNKVDEEDVLSNQRQVLANPTCHTHTATPFTFPPPPTTTAARSVLTPGTRSRSSLVHPQPRIRTGAPGGRPAATQGVGVVGSPRPQTSAVPSMAPHPPEPSLSPLHHHSSSHQDIQDDGGGGDAWQQHNFQQPSASLVTSSQRRLHYPTPAATQQSSEHHSRHSVNRYRHDAIATTTRLPPQPASRAHSTAVREREREQYCRLQQRKRARQSQFQFSAQQLYARPLTPLTSDYYGSDEGHTDDDDSHDYAVMGGRRFARGTRRGIARALRCQFQYRRQYDGDALGDPRAIETAISPSARVKVEAEDMGGSCAPADTHGGAAEDGEAMVVEVGDGWDEEVVCAGGGRPTVQHFGDAAGFLQRAERCMDINNASGVPADALPLLGIVDITRRNATDVKEVEVEVMIKPEEPLPANVSNYYATSNATATVADTRTLTGWEGATTDAPSAAVSSSPSSIASTGQGATRHSTPTASPNLTATPSPTPARAATPAVRLATGKPPDPRGRQVVAFLERAAASATAATTPSAAESDDPLALRSDDSVPGGVDHGSDCVASTLPDVHHVVAIPQQQQQHAAMDMGVVMDLDLDLANWQWSDTPPSPTLRASQQQQQRHGNAPLSPGTALAMVKALGGGGSQATATASARGIELGLSQAQSEFKWQLECEPMPPPPLPLPLPIPVHNTIDTALLPAPPHPGHARKNPHARTRPRRRSRRARYSADRDDGDALEPITLFSDTDGSDCGTDDLDGGDAVRGRSVMASEQQHCPRPLASEGQQHPASDTARGSGSATALYTGPAPVVATPATGANTLVLWVALGDDAGRADGDGDSGSVAGGRERKTVRFAPPPMSDVGFTIWRDGYGC